MSGAGTIDFFCREAQRLGYAARSAFKLVEIQTKFKVIKFGASVLDLGCAPGAWLQVACQNLGDIKNGGSIIGLDMKKVKVPHNYTDARVKTVSADFMKTRCKQLRELSPQDKGYSVVLSDMCPAVSGIRTKDETLSCELGRRALFMALGENKFTATKKDIGVSDDEWDVDYEASDDTLEGILQGGGNLVIKLLECPESQGFPKFCKPNFRKVSWLRPKATRPSSREIYLICQGLK